MDNDFVTGYALGADSASNDKVCVVPTNNGGGFGSNGGWGEMIFAIIILAMFAGGDGFGGLFGNRGGGANFPAFQGAVTRADLCSKFNFNNLRHPHPDSVLRRCSHQRHRRRVPAAGQDLPG